MVLPNWRLSCCSETGALVNVKGDASGSGILRVGTFNDVEAYDDVRLDTGGLIVGSGATSRIVATLGTILS